ncbi:MAG TPA: protease modulator HflC [Candidatus Omnitrophica bacterium]|nr:protease modulator HflC [Candidatus Omnitrophota bacterium]
MRKGVFIGIGILIVLMFLNSIMYTIPETHQVVITQFGEPIRVVKEAGLHFKKPIVHQVNYFEKRLLEWDGKPTQIPTFDKRYIWVDSFARWKIEDPLKFFQTVRNEISAHARLDDIVNSAVRNQISSHLLIETIRSRNRPMLSVVRIEGEKIAEVPDIEKGREKITELILKEAVPSASKYGIKLVDIRIKRVNYVEEVREAVYERMIVERKRIAAKYRSEGEGEMMEIMGKKEKEEKEILSGVYREAQEIKGKADAEAIKIYAEAYSKDPEFYSFLKALETYEQSLTKGSILILSTDSDYLRYLKSEISLDTPRGLNPEE